MNTVIMIISLVVSNVLWFLVTAYLIWFVTGRPNVPGIVTHKVAAPTEEVFPEASDEQILAAFKSGGYNIDEIPDVEDGEIE